MLCSHYVKSVPRGRIFGHLFLAKCSDSVYNPLNTVYSLPYKIYIVCCTVYTVLHYVVQQLSVCFILWKMSPAILYCINHRTVDWANVLRPVKHGSFRDMHVLEQKDEDCQSWNASRAVIRLQTFKFLKLSSFREWEQGLFNFNFLHFWWSSSNPFSSLFSHNDAWIVGGKNFSLHVYNLLNKAM